MAGLGPFKMVNAAEILRYTGAAWPEAEVELTEKHFREVIYPVIKDFAPFANGNWDTAAIKTMMAIGVFCNDRPIFERALHYYVGGAGNGRLAHYIINETGQCQESGRDQQHTQLGLAHLGDCCEIAWHQGLDLYGYDDNRLLKGFEYTAKYNLGEEVPFAETVDRTGKYHHTLISTNGRGRFRAVFEQIFNHYANRAGISAPYTQRAAESIRPEGSGGPGADHVGFGTLLFSRPAAKGAASVLNAPGPAGGVIAQGSSNEIKLTWIGSAGAENYTIKRVAENDDYEIVARKIMAPACTDTNQIESPDGKVAVKFLLQTGGVPAYSIAYGGKPVVLESRLGLLPDFTNGFEIKTVSRCSHNDSWSSIYGERKIIPDHYRELNVDLKQASGRLLRVTFRAYDEGAAFRYSFPRQKTREFHLTGEQSEFRFPENTFGYEEHGTEGEYRRARTADIAPWCERPLTIEYAGGFFACLGEADNENYPRMLLSPLPGVPGALVSALGGTTANTAWDTQPNNPSAKLAAGDSTPWRLFVVGEKPGDLLERDYLMLDLNPTVALKDVSWIKPGKAMRDTTLTTAHSKAIIDFAAQAGLQYVSLDAGWYGTENFDLGDATQARTGGGWVHNLAQPVDIREIIRYGREKRVGVILYVDRRQIKKQRDILFPLYEKWGIQGVKIGFVDVGPQTETAWITETIKKAAEHHLMLNIHDGYRPTGLVRAFPNLMTVEGVRGNEHFPTPGHNCTLPFTRYIAGSADYTVCYFDDRCQTTYAHQLAMSVVSYSPLQWIFWYDSPAMYHGEPEIEFFRHVPTVWDDTKVINGEIGKFATIARRSGGDWFVGTINDSKPRTLKVPLAFLGQDQRYTAHIYSDDDAVQTHTHVGLTTCAVDARTVLEVLLHSGGGQAVWITPRQPKENH